MQKGFRKNYPLRDVRKESRNKVPDSGGPARKSGVLEAVRKYYNLTKGRR